MDLETIANVVDSSNLDPNIALTKQALTSISYYFPTLAAPSVIYHIIRRTTAKYHTKTNPLTTALAAAAITTIPAGFLAGAVVNDNLLGLHNVAAYLLGSVFAAYQHYSTPHASPPAQASIK